MDDDKPNNELDNLFREELENLPEEKPSARDWQQLSYRLQSEGLSENGERKNGRKYFLFLLLLLVLSGVVSLPFIMRNKDADGTKENATENAVGTTQQTPINNQAPINQSQVNQASIDQSSINQEPINQSSINSGEASVKNETPMHRLSGQGTVSETKVAVDKDHNASQGANEEKSSPAKGTTTASASANKETTDSKNTTTRQPGAQTETATASSEKDMSAENTSAAPTQGGTNDGKSTEAGAASSDSLNAMASQLTAGQNDSLATQQKDSMLQADLNKKESTQLKRFRMGIYFSLDYNYYTLKNNSDAAQAESDFVNQSDAIKGEKWGGQYTVGIIGGYLFTQRLSLEAGVFYSQKKKLHADIYTPTYTTPDQEMYSDFTYDYQARYVEIYGRVKYYFNQKKNPLYATLGAAGSFNSVNNNSSDYFLRTSYGNASTETEHVALNASSAGLILIVSAGMEIPVGERFIAYVEPAYKYSLDPVIKHPGVDRVPVEHFLRSLSLATGLMYKF